MFDETDTKSLQSMEQQLQVHLNFEKVFIWGQFCRPIGAKACLFHQHLH